MVVAQVVEAELVVRAVGDVAGVGLAARGVVEVVLDAADGEAEGAVDPAHPLRVAAGEVVVHGHDVRSSSGDRVQGDGERRDERLALARPHLGNLPLVEDGPAPELDVVVALADRPLARLAHEGEDAREERVEDRPGLRTARLEVGREVLQLGLDPFPDLAEAGAEAVQGQRGELGLQPADLLDERREHLHVAVVLRPEDLGECLVDDHLPSMGARRGRNFRILAEGLEVARRRADRLRTRSGRSRAG